MAAWTALAAACLLEQVAAGSTLGWQAEAQAEVREYARPRPEPSEAALELELTPRAALELASPHDRLALTYAPLLIVTTAPRRDSPETLLHRVTLSETWRPDPTLRLTASADGSHGTIDALQLVPTSGGQVESVPAVRRLQYLSAQGLLRIESTPGERSRLMAAGEWVIEGGEGSPSRTALPQQWGPTGRFSLLWWASRLDALETSATAAQRTFWYIERPVNRGTSAWTVQATESWRRRLGTRIEAWLGLGLALDGDAGARHPLPAGDLGFQIASADEASRVRIGGRYGPFVDSVTGRTYDRADASVAAVWAFDRRWSLAADLAGGRARGGPQDGESVMVGELRATWKAARELELTWGARTRLQEPAAATPEAQALHQWTIFSSVSYSARGRM